MPINDIPTLVCVNLFALLPKLEAGIPAPYTNIGVCDANKRPSQKSITNGGFSTKLFQVLFWGFS